MISVIHPSSHFMGGAGARVPPSFPAQGMMASNSAGFTNMATGPTMSNYGHQLMMAKASEPISYRRLDSGYTHHVSNSSSGDYQLRPAQARSSSSRSLSTSYKKVASTGSVRQQQQQPQQRSRGLVLPPHGSSSSSKDYSKPLFVDCSIEYELPNAPKIPKNSQPILMIHPGYKARLQPQKKECHQRGACQCNTHSQPAQQPKRTAVKRSYATAMTNDFYKLHQQTSAPAHHAYFDNSSTSSALEALAMQAAKRSRTMQMAEKQLFDHQQFFQQQQMQQAALRHYHQQSYYRPDLRISSFQQITPPESLAFWQQQQQQQQQQQHMMCRPACCTTTSTTNTTFKYSPPTMAPMCCYPMPPTPMVTNNNAAPNAGFCLGCAQGKCQQVNKQKNNLGIMRSL